MTEEIEDTKFGTEDIGSEINCSDSIRDTIKSTKLSTDQIDKLSELISLIPEILSKTDNKEYDEIFGYRINVDTESNVNISVRNEILLKFLIANKYNVDVTKKKLIDTLSWRNRFQPLSAAFEEEFNEMLDKLGVITVFPRNSDNLKVFTWNLYGNLKSPKKLFEKFGNDEEKGDKPGSQFLRWRIGLMERSLSIVDFTDPSNNRIAQVHDYKNVSMFRMDPGMKSATKEIISIFGDNYPELLSVKFFINVPSIMSWVFTFFKKTGFISTETIKKFQVLNNGNLSEWCDQQSLPSDYNGDVENENVKSLFDLNSQISSKINVPEYGSILLKKINEQNIKEVNISVE